ncbi:hypothetical protein J2S13_000360 [Oikeobacillus pervagus]|uniref:DUF4176 domain-containing protein n=1 Tax=Oikeobacillus pervagus TaxID=1325931 RepID=A0AAJ1T325_9BACI|nr:DUF4176 domain-containing protein [Oikeobacillus pervagus]MDQ0213965.1 hypothetical protein [Oikeobacillus pervagus]
MQKEDESIQFSDDIELLPIGTVVKLKKVEKPVMIYGRHQMQTSSRHIYDYIAVPYPEGNITDDFNMFFNRNMIEEVLHLGYETAEEKEMREKVEFDIQSTRKQSKLFEQ